MSTERSPMTRQFGTNKLNHIQIGTSLMMEMSLVRRSVLRSNTCTELLAIVLLVAVFV